MNCLKGLRLHRLSPHKTFSFSSHLPRKTCRTAASGVVPRRLSRVDCDGPVCSKQLTPSDGHSLLPGLKGATLQSSIEQRRPALLDPDNGLDDPMASYNVAVADHSGTGMLLGGSTSHLQHNIVPRRHNKDLPQRCTLRAVAHGSATARGELKSAIEDRHRIEKPFASAIVNEVRRGGDSVDYDSTSSLVAVFDGHGGTISADYASRRLHELIRSEVDIWEALGSAWLRSETRQAEAIAHTMKAVFARCDAEILARLHRDGVFDGTTALVCIQLDDRLYIANAGDCRAVLCRGGAAVRLTEDHKPETRREKARIEAEGGEVHFLKGAFRVVREMSSLPPASVEKGSQRPSLRIASVSRGFGDPEFKMPRRLITPDPDVTVVKLQPGTDRFVILGSDGLFGFLSDSAAVEVVKEVVYEMSDMSSATPQTIATAAARALVRAARDQGSMDDVTAVVMLLDWERPE